MKVSARKDDGEWVEVGYVDGPIGFASPADWGGDEVRHTLREFSGHLTFDVTPNDRATLREYIITRGTAIRAEASRMHSAYRAKTRRRNRKRR